MYGIIPTNARGMGETYCGLTVTIERGVGHPGLVQYDRGSCQQCRSQDVYR